MDTFTVVNKTCTGIENTAKCRTNNRNCMKLVTNNKLFNSYKPLHLECSYPQQASFALLPETALVASEPVSHSSNIINSEAFTTSVGVNTRVNIPYVSQIQIQIQAVQCLHLVTSGKKLSKYRERMFKQKCFLFTLENVGVCYFLNCMG